MLGQFVASSCGRELGITPCSYAHPHDVDSDQHVDGVVAGDPLEHAKGGVVPCLLGDIIGERHFVDAQGALEQEKECTA